MLFDEEDFISDPKSCPVLPLNYICIPPISVNLCPYSALSDDITLGKVMSFTLWKNDVSMFGLQILMVNWLQ